MSRNCGTLVTLAPFRIAILVNASFIANKDPAGRLREWPKLPASIIKHIIIAIGSVIVSSAFMNNP